MAMSIMAEARIETAVGVALALPGIVTYKCAGGVTSFIMRWSSAARGLVTLLLLLESLSFRGSLEVHTP